MQFRAGHAPGAAGIPLEELPGRVHELPPKDTELSVADPDAGRAEQGAEFLRRRGHAVTVVAWDTLNLTETGPSTTRLWSPNPFLVEALAAVGGRVAGSVQSNRRALDVACGSGRDAVYLALEEYEVEAIDMLPDALSRARDLARRSGVYVRTRALDLVRDPDLPDNRYQIVAVFRYLQRALFPAIRQAVAPGGYIVYETFHERNLQTGRRPSNPEHLLKTGELLAVFEGFDVLIANDAICRDGRYFSHLLAQRPTL